MCHDASKDASDVHTRAFLCSLKACVIAQVVMQVTQASLELNKGDKRKMKAHECGQVLLAFEACILIKVERKEERQVERKWEDESAQMWTGIVCIWGMCFDES